MERTETIVTIGRKGAETVILFGEGISKKKAIDEMESVIEQLRENKEEHIFDTLYRLKQR